MNDFFCNYFPAIVTGVACAQLGDNFWASALATAVIVLAWEASFILGVG
jgi:hypothetical protein